MIESTTNRVIVRGVRARDLKVGKTRIERPIQCSACRRGVYDHDLWARLINRGQIYETWIHPHCLDKLRRMMDVTVLEDLRPK